MTYAYTRPQGSRRIYQDESGNPSAKGQNGCYPWCKTGKVLGIYRSRPCQLPAEFICWFPASAAKWL